MSDGSKPSTLSRAYSTYKKGKGKYDTYKKYKDYYDRVKKVVDEETRSGALFKEAVGGVLNLASKLLGVSLTSHPYYTYHKVHLDVLEAALNMASAYDRALADWDRAARSAKKMQVSANIAEGYRQRRKALIGYYAFPLQGTLETLNRSTGKDGVGPAERDEILRMLDDWRWKWDDLVFESLTFLFMVQVEARGIELVMQQSGATLEKQSREKGYKGNLGLIGKHSYEKQRKFAELDLARKQIHGAGRDAIAAAAARADPVKAAQRSLAEIDRIASRNCACAVVAASSAAERSPKITCEKLSIIDKKG